MKRLLLLIALVVSLVVVTLPLVAADLPVVRQPSDPAFSAADRAAMASAWGAIQDTLQADFSLARFVHLQGLSWSDADFVQFAAGTLQAAGYTVLLATGSWAAGCRTRGSSSACRCRRPRVHPGRGGAAPFGSSLRDGPDRVAR